jgi:hypothetical protein
MWNKQPGQARPGDAEQMSEDEKHTRQRLAARLYHTFDEAGGFGDKKPDREEWIKSALAMPYDQFVSWVQHGMRDLQIRPDDSVKEMLEAVRKVQEKS